MAISDAQKEALRRMCPASQTVDLGQLIQDAEAGGMTAGTGLDITDGVISIDDGGVDTTQLAADAVDGTKIADDAIDTEHIADDAVETAQIADSAVDTDQIADGAVTAGKLDAGIALVENPLSGPAVGEKLLRKQIVLAGANPTNVAIAGADDAATLLGSEDGPFVLTVGNTFIVNPNGEGEKPWTVAGTAGVSTGDTGCSEDMTAETDTKFRIKVDDAADWSEVTCDWAGCNSGALIAAQMQIAIRALLGVYELVTVAFSTDHYVVTSADFGTGSKVNITEALTLSCTEELKIGNNFGASEAAGTGDAVLLSAATAAECAAKIAALDAALINTAAEAGKIRLNAIGAGGASSLVVGDGTENAVLGFTNLQADYGDVGMGAGHDMADATYTVMLTPVTDAPGGVDTISVHNKAVGGFDIYAETAVAIPVDVLVIGVLAT